MYTQLWHIQLEVCHHFLIWTVQIPPRQLRAEYHTAMEVTFRLLGCFTFVSIFNTHNDPPGPSELSSLENRVYSCHFHLHLYSTGLWRLSGAPSDFHSVSTTAAAPSVARYATNTRSKCALPTSVTSSVNITINADCQWQEIQPKTGGAPPV